MKIKIENYTFDSANRTITFTDYSSIRLDGVLLITNVNYNIIIYNFADRLKGGTVLNNVLTLMYNTTAMSNTDKLLIYYDDIVDGRLVYSGTINTISQGVAIDTSGYGSMVIQFSGNWIGKIYFETSNDTIFWDTCFILSREEVSLQDVVDQNGTYSVKRAGRYIRYNCQKISGSADITIVGREGEGLNAADLLSFAMDRTNQTPLQVQLPKDLKQDTSGAIILADMLGPIYWNSTNAASPITIDCTGYSTVIVQKTTAGVVTPSVSNDGINFLGTLAATTASATAMAATIPTAVGVYVIPIVAKYLKLTGPASSVQCIIFLSQALFNQGSIIINPPVNVAQFAGTTALAGGTAGSIVIGGGSATGVPATTAPAINPIQIAGVDDIKGPGVTTTAYIRRLLTDSLGRIQIGTGTGQPTGTGSSKALNEIGFLSDYKNVLEVRDIQRIEGSSNLDLLQGILTELKILNQQIYELPRLMVIGRPANDSPEAFRNDPTMFNN